LVIALHRPTMTSKTRAALRTLPRRLRLPIPNSRREADETLPPYWGRAMDGTASSPAVSSTRPRRWPKRAPRPTISG
jgi:hypothetical protein